MSRPEAHTLSPRDSTVVLTLSPSLCKRQALRRSTLPERACKWKRWSQRGKRNVRAGLNKVKLCLHQSTFGCIVACQAVSQRHNDQTDFIIWPQPPCEPITITHSKTVIVFMKFTVYTQF